MFADTKSKGVKTNYSASQREKNVTVSGRRLRGDGKKGESGGGLEAEGSCPLI